MTQTRSAPVRLIFRIWVGALGPLLAAGAGCVPKDAAWEPLPDASESGGSTGSGGASAGTGGASTGTGGASGTGGRGTGGAATGGRGAGGAGGAGGRGTGGASATGGRGTGGAAATGGASATGGRGTGGAATGGASATGGAGGTAPPGLSIQGRALKDPCGATVLIRGFEQQVRAGLLAADGGIPEMAKTGANYVRLLVTVPPAAMAVPSVATLGTYIDLARANGMLLELALDDGTTNGSVYNRQEVKDVLFGKEDTVLVQAAGEGTQAADNAWVSETRARITQVRGYGYRHVLFVGSRLYARSPGTVLMRGAEVLSADTTGNTHFFVQLFWGTNAAGTNYYEDQFGMTVEQALDSFAASSLAIQAGLLSDDTCCSTYPWVDFESAMARAQTAQVGWLWRDWHNPSDGFNYHLTTNGVSGSWASNASHPLQPNHGQQVSVGHAASIMNTSVRTAYLRNRTCN